MEIILEPSVMFVAPRVFRVKRLPEIFRDKRQVQLCVIKRQVVVWFLHREGISISGIVALTGVNRTTIYAQIHKVDDMLSVGDKLITEMVEKINRAKVETRHVETRHATSLQF